MSRYLDSSFVFWCGLKRCINIREASRTVCMFADYDAITQRFESTVTHVVSNGKYTVSIIHCTVPRSFNILCVMAHTSLSISDLQAVMHALENFLHMTSESQPCYITLDIRAADVITIQQVSQVASVFRRLKSDLELKLVGTVILSELTQGWIGTMLSKVYVPVRPICWWAKAGDSVRFIESWEAEM